MKFHKNLKQEDWNALTLEEQLANIGSEVIRSIKWKAKGNKEYSELAFFRALELLNLTKNDPSKVNRLKEIGRTYEVLVDFFAGNNIYHTDATSLERYFIQFTYLARKDK